MAWTYISTGPGSSARSWVRLRVGDTTSASQLIQDEEIDAILDSESNKHLAAAVTAEAIAGSFARRADKTVGRMSVQASQHSQNYFELSDRLRLEAAQRAAPYGGGIRISDVDLDKDDSDRVDPAFSLGVHDFTPPSST